MDKDIQAIESHEVGTDSSFWAGLGGFIVISIGIVSVWFLGFSVFPFLFPPKPGEGIGPGVAGDMFGSLTALFSGLAFAGLISTLLMQRKELEFQREELRLSRSEFHLQRFENTLFGLLRMFSEHIASLEHNGPPIRTGREVLVHYARQLPDEQTSPDDRSPNSHNPTLEDQKENYLSLYEHSFEPDLGPYFRLLYNTVRHVHHSGLPLKDRQKYAKIVRAYLGSSEVKLLMFNCSTRLGEDFRPWVEEYGLLKHLHPEDIRRNEKMVSSYTRAFAGRTIKNPR